MTRTSLAGRGRQTGRGLGPRITEFVNWCRSLRYPRGRRICLAGPGPAWPGEAGRQDGPLPRTMDYKVCQFVLQNWVFPWKENFLPGLAWPGKAGKWAIGFCLGAWFTKFVNWCCSKCWQIDLI